MYNINIKKLKSLLNQRLKLCICVLASAIFALYFGYHNFYYLNTINNNHYKQI